ncbi:hypothetical protein Y032_0346g3130 [Ancylostoma ceylanicum]|uniref:HTH OST-type domain-containing protein n=1 Tax=Ancylostoma ceylanicum TaxID=53326 RepID=A0A016RXX4_9BILA|nr:hypothetical protein Y032_0346g3130 [Ancylostoma ceylanicum]
MSGLDSLLSELSSVIMTKATKGGITEQEIMREYLALCGKRVEFAKHGHRSLGELLSSHPEKFSCSGGRWFGKITEENENIIRAMATEKSKRGRGSLRARVFGQGSRAYTPRSTAGPSSFSRGDPHSRPRFPQNDLPPPSFFPRGNTQPFGQNDQPRFHQSSSDGVLPRFDDSHRNSDRRRDNGSPVVSNEGGWKATEKVPAKTGFGNKSFNYVPSETASTSSRSASVDPYRDEDDDDMPPPPGLNEPRPRSPGSEKFSESRSESFRGMVANDVPAPEYPPGLEVDGGKDEPTIPPPRSETFRGMVASDVEVPAYPPGLSVEGTEKQPATAASSGQPPVREVFIFCDYYPGYRFRAAHVNFL